MRIRVIAVSAGVLALAGCATTPPRLDVERQWRESIGNLGMVAIYPPSEDVMVGDAFIFVPDARNFDLVRITSAPRELLAEHLCWQEQDRLVLDNNAGASRVVNAPRSGNPGPNTSRGSAPAPESNCARLRSNQRRVAPFDQPTEATHATRLREAAIPTLEVGRFSQGELAGAGLLGNFGAALGIGGASAAAVRVELKQLQGLTLDELRGSRLLEAISVARLRRGGERDYPNALTPLMLARTLWHADNRNGTDLLDRFCRGAFDRLDETGARLLVANRVLYAAEISFDFLSQSVGAFRAALDFASVMPNRPQPTTTPPLPNNPLGTTPLPGPASPELDKELARLMKLANGILELPASTPGQASARLTVGRFGNLALARTFASPAAVGMGAALYFPLGDAAVPANADQIEDAMRFCQATAGTQANALRQRLHANLRWAEYLKARADGASAEMAARLPEGRTAEAGPSEASGRSRLPALPPNAKLRVGL